jgi:hypothetical protein
VPLYLALFLYKYDINVDLSLADIRRVWIDDSYNFVTVNFKSDGYLRIEGLLPNLTDIDYLFKPDGKMIFHTPAEHTFNG